MRMAEPYRPISCDLQREPRQVHRFCSLLSHRIKKDETERVSIQTGGEGPLALEDPANF